MFKILRFLLRSVLKLLPFLIFTFIIDMCFNVFEHPVNRNLERSDYFSRFNSSFTGVEYREAVISARPDSCVPASNVAYLKVHKTGSSAIQAALFRYGIKHNLNFAMSEHSQFDMRKPFQRIMVYPRSMLGKVQFNIFAIHCRWNMKEVLLLMPKDTVFIASVREPTSLFDSLYGYYNFKERTHMTLNEYVRFMTKKPFDPRRQSGIIGYNQMLFDFGLSEAQTSNLEEAQKLVDQVDKDYDLVLVAEKMEESLILLRHLLCWTYEDVATLKVNARYEKSKEEITEETKTILNERLDADWLLYNHFRKKLERFIEDFGKEKMEEEIRQLRETTNTIKNDCGILEVTPAEENGESKLWAKRVLEYKTMAEGVSEECLLYTFSENELKDYVRIKQIEKYGTDAEKQSM